MELLKCMVVVHVHWNLVNKYIGSTVNVCYITHSVQMCYKQCGLVDHNVVSENVNISSDFVFFSLFHKC